MTRSTDPQLPVPAPVVNPESRPFWEATAQGKLLLSSCPECKAVIWYPRSICPHCHHPETEWIEALGTGVIYSFCIVRRGVGEYVEATPYVLAYVELNEGVRVLTNIVGCVLSELEIGDKVRVEFHDTGVGYALPRFAPVVGGK